MNSTKSYGKLGEEIARNLLIGRGYRIIAQNFKSYFGEIDIIAKDDDTLVFIEVKARWSKKFGGPLESITPWKLTRIKKTAEYFYLKHPELTYSQRIEVCAIEFENGILKSSEFIEVD